MADDVVRDPPGAIWKRLDVIARRITDHYTAGPEEDHQLAFAISDLRLELQKSLRACADDLETAPSPQREALLDIQSVALAGSRDTSDLQARLIHIGDLCSVALTDALVPSTDESRRLVAYDVPNEQRTVLIDYELSRGAPVMDFTLADGRIVQITRNDDYCRACDREGSSAGGHITDTEYHTCYRIPRLEAAVNRGNELLDAALAENKRLRAAALDAVPSLKENHESRSPDGDGQASAREGEVAPARANEQLPHIAGSEPADSLTLWEAITQAVSTHGSAATFAACAHPNCVGLRAACCPRWSDRDCLSCFGLGPVNVPPSEICICAAVQFADGRIVRGHRHDSCFITAGGWTPKPPREHVQGFITSRNRFVGRKEAMQLMAQTDLFSAHTGLRFAGRPASDVLFSEDLYFDAHDHVAMNTPYQEPAGAAVTDPPSAVVRKLEMLSEHMRTSPVSVVPAYGESLGDLVEELKQQSAPSASAVPWDLVRQLSTRCRELVFAWAGDPTGTEPLSQTEIKDTFKCLQAAADYLENFAKRAAAVARSAPGAEK